MLAISVILRSKNYFFGILYSFAERLPILKLLQRSVSFEIFTAVIVPPALGVFSDVGEFCIFVLYIVYIFWQSH